MAYDGKILSRAMQRYNEDKQRRSAQQEAARARACREEPRLGQIRQTMQGTVGRVLAEAMSRGEDPMPALEALRKENLGLQQERAELLRSHGWPTDLMEDKPRCILCGDTGFRQGRMCSCLQKYYAREQIEELSRLLDVGSQSFESFDLEWYSCEVGQYGRSPRETMERNLSICRTFAQSFGSDSGNLLLFGAPGLGKTFLSACIARVVSEDGFSVVYDTAMRIFSRFEAAKFRAFDDPEAQEDTERYLRCDLLILDDLGTEMTTTMVQSALYQIINGRLLSGRSTVISTNLMPAQLGERYGAQIRSRLEGEYQLLPFIGEDIRRLKRERGIS